MKTIFAFLVAVILQAAAVDAQDISIKMQEITRGSTVTIRNSDGKVYTHQHLGKIRGVYAFRTFSGRRAKGHPLGTYFTNVRGELMRAEDRNGAVTKWEPHKCMRTLGQCRYTRILPDGTRQKRTRITEATEDGFRYAIYEDSGELVLSGWAKIDQFGWSVRGAYKPNGGKRISLRMLASDYQ